MPPVKPIITNSENIAKLRENYMNSLISRQERGEATAGVLQEAGLAAQFEIAIQLAKLNEILETNLGDFPARVADVVSDAVKS